MAGEQAGGDEPAGPLLESGLGLGPGLERSILDLLRGVLARGEPVRDAELHDRATDGVWSASAFVVDDAAGRRMGAAAVLADLSAGRRAEADQRRLRLALVREQAILHGVIERVPARIAVLWGPEHRFRLVNERYLDLVPPRGELLGRTVLEVFPEAQAAIPLLDAARHEGRVLEDEQLIVPFAGERAFEGHRHYRVSFTPIPDPDPAGGGVLIVAIETKGEVARGRQLERRLEVERHIAETLQRYLLPRELPEVPELELAARYRPAGPALQVGGDFYDAFALPGRRWALVIGDVCGKGPDAAAVTALVRHTLRADARHEPRPARLLGQLNETLLREPEREIRFCSVAVAVLEPGPLGVSVTMAAGGHPPPVVLRSSGQARPLDRAGAVIGVLADPGLSEAAFTLAPGDALVLYTDGVLEAGAPRRLVHPDELARQLAGHAGDDAESLVELLESSAVALAAGEPRDDIAVLAARARPVP